MFKYPLVCDSLDIDGYLMTYPLAMPSWKIHELNGGF